MNERVAAEIAAYAKREADQASEKALSFAQRLAEDPFAAFYGCRFHVTNAAAAHVWTVIATVATPERAFSSLVERAERGIQAPYGQSASDPFVNEMRRQEGAAWVQVREYLRDFEDLRSLAA